MKPARLGLMLLFLHASCDALWHPFRIPNGQACEQAAADFCRPGMFCDRVLNTCVPDTAPTPSVSSVTPALGPTSGGTTLTLDGSNFVAGTGVSIAGLAATQVTVVSPNRITLSLPASPGSLGLVPIVVSNPDGHSSSRSDLFSYYLTTISFGAMTSFASGSSGPYVIDVGDFNSDSQTDIAILHSPGVSLRTLFGNGQIQFAPGKSSAVPGGAHGIVLGDFNQDGRVDIAVVATSVFVFLGKAGGALDNAIEMSAGVGPLGLVTGDFDEDGRLDLATAAATSGDVNVLIGSGTGTFAAAVAYPLAAGSRPTWLHTSDLNADGHLDLVVADATQGAVHVLLGDGRGHFGSSAMYATATDQRGVTSGDFNGDGKPDLAVADGYNNSVSILLGDGSGGFGPAKRTIVGSQANEFDARVTAIDIDGDRNLDLVYTNAYERQVVILPGRGNGTFPKLIRIPVGKQPTSVSLYDWNGDGKKDLTVCNYGDDAIGVLINESQ